MAETAENAVRPVGTLLLGAAALKRFPFSCVRLVLGVVLLVAAGLKAYGLVFDPVSQDSFLASHRLVTAAIEIETLLGLWLLSGWSGRAARLATLGFFGILAGVSFYLALTGQPSCGCLGPFTVKPWFIFAFDAAAILALLTCSPSLTGDFRKQSKTETKEVLTRSIGRNFSSWVPGILKVGVGAAGILSVIGGVLLFVFGDVNEALAWLRSESITVEPSVNHVGDGVAGEQRTFTIQLVNYRDRPIKVFGGTTTCSCIVTDDLPIILPPKESSSIAVRIRFRGSPGRFRHSFVFYIDEEKQATVIVWFSGRVIESPSP